MWGEGGWGRWGGGWGDGEMGGWGDGKMGEWVRREVGIAAGDDANVLFAKCSPAIFSVKCSL